ncbi:unnamed protein product [Eruca vesicaria subsp. sativa]|uniref:Uncharacterized protein n=1 Tax=Eruca vesicaria subsp. sativa TaxID=29727 RepID=A0ABC8LVV4_ERUVS|nr:unnamed protein product [Eruca vesicaria subsp. sativa]
MEVQLINSPPGSKKDYKSLVLYNGLKVILISDPKTTESAAAMTVRVGSSSDPSNAEGLAHLLEHMLFTGCKAYPHPNELDDFLSQYNGVSNAFTEMDFTMFHFNVMNAGFQGALERFCEQFISPLFQEDCLEAEITAIEHEFELDRQNDMSMLDQLKGHTASAGHPFKRFTWGNRESLSKVKKVELIELLWNLFNKHFVGSSMCLVVLGKEPVGVLKGWVIDYFGRIKKGTEFISNYNPTPGPIWKVDTLFLSKSVEDIHLFDITWIIPPKSYMKSSEQFLVIAFSHKGEGSLYSIFKKKGWLMSLKASSGDYKSDECKGTYACTSVGHLFSLSLVLTNLGYFNVFHIVGYVYQYLQFLRDKEAPEIMKEFFSIKKIKFQCFDTYDLGSDPCALTKQVAVNMLHIPLEDAVCADFLNESCTRDSINELLKHFIPGNMRLDLASKYFSGKDLLEPKFNTFYKELEIPRHWIVKWLNPCYGDVCFKFPRKNQFLPTAVPPPLFLPTAVPQPLVLPTAVLHSDDGEEIDGSDDSDDSDESDESDYNDESDEEYDKEAESFLFVDKNSIKLWHSRDEGVPTFNFAVYCNIGDDLKSQVLGVFYLHLLNDSLALILSEGMRANFSTSVTLSDKNKIEIRTRGFKERFSLYISKIWNVLTCFSPSRDSFTTDKEVVVAVLKNNVAELSDHSKVMLQAMVSASCHSFDAMLDVLKQLKFEDMVYFVSDLRKKMFVEGVFCGDIPKDEALSISELFESDKIVPLEKNCRGDLRIDVIPHASVSTKSLKSDKNSLATVCFQIGIERNDAQNTALLHLFYSLIEENTIHWLRVKNNLGYEVGSELQFKDGINLFSITVVSSMYNPEYLLVRIREYVEGLETFLNGVKSHVFENHKKALRDDYPDGFGWKQISERRLFPRFNKIVRRSLKEIVETDVIYFYKKYFTEASPDTRMLSISIWGCNSHSSFA